MYLIHMLIMPYHADRCLKNIMNVYLKVLEKSLNVEVLQEREACMVLLK